MGDETHRISRDAAVWAVAFSKSVLVVTDWNDTLSFYNTQGQQILKDRNIGKEYLLFTLLKVKKETYVRRQKQISLLQRIYRSNQVILEPSLYKRASKLSSS